VAPPVVHVAPPVVHVAPPVVHVAPPVVHVAPPDVHVAPPVVHVAPPVVHVAVAPPVVHVAAPIAVPAARAAGPSESGAADQVPMSLRGLAVQLRAGQQQAQVLVNGLLDGRWPRAGARPTQATQWGFAVVNAVAAVVAPRLVIHNLDMHHGPPPPATRKMTEHAPQTIRKMQQSHPLLRSPRGTHRGPLPKTVERERLWRDDQRSLAMVCAAASADGAQAPAVINTIAKGLRARSDAALGARLLQEVDELWSMLR